MEANKKERFMVRFITESGTLTCKVLRPVIFKIGEVAKMKYIDTIKKKIPAGTSEVELAKIKSNIIRGIEEERSCQIVDITGVF